MLLFEVNILVRSNGESMEGAQLDPPLFLGKKKLQKEEKPAGQANPKPPSSRLGSATKKAMVFVTLLVITLVYKFDVQVVCLNSVS